jgi:thiamine kinase-like enzyme
MPLIRFEAAAEHWVPGTGPVQIEPLAAGLVNESCRVVRAGRAYTLRLAAADSEQLGLDRGWECAVRERAAAAGLAAAVHCCRPLSGILVTDWVTGRTWSAADTRLPDNIDVMAELLRRVHALEIPQPERRMDPAAWIAYYGAALERHAPDARATTGLPASEPPCSAPLRSEPLRSSLLRGVSDLRLGRMAGERPFAAVLCHSDLHRQNLLIGERPILLDWEYAHVSDGFWDLAGWVSNNDWGADEAEQLLAGYLRRPVNRADLERLAAWAWLYDYVCLLWSELYLIRRPGADRAEIAARAEVIATRLARGAT